MQRRNFIAGCGAAGSLMAVGSVARADVIDELERSIYALESRVDASVCFGVWGGLHVSTSSYAVDHRRFDTATPLNSDGMPRAIFFSSNNQHIELTRTGVGTRMRDGRGARIAYGVYDTGGPRAGRVGRSSRFFALWYGDPARVTNATSPIETELARLSLTVPV